MSLQTDQHRVSDELFGRLRDAPAVTAELLHDVIHEACWRFLSVRPTENAARIERLIESGAWTDAALTLIELELPHWQLRRIAYDSGEWCCALSRQRELPDWLDQSAEACHADLALAILMAFSEARRAGAAPARTSVPSAPGMTSETWMPLCADNFA